MSNSAAAKKPTAAGKSAVAGKPAVAKKHAAAKKPTAAGKSAAAGEAVSRGAPPVMEHEKFVREGPQKRFIEPRLLYLIRKSPSYGYQLMEDIGSLPFPGPVPDSAAVYRMLRELEKAGLVRSEWEHGEAGPSKRVYSITQPGEERLTVWVRALEERVKMLNEFISLCEKGG